MKFMLNGVQYVYGYRMYYKVPSWDGKRPYTKGIFGYIGPALRSEGNGIMIQVDNKFCVNAYIDCVEGLHFFVTKKAAKTYTKDMRRDGKLTKYTTSLVVARLDETCCHDDPIKVRARRLMYAPSLEAAKHAIEGGLLTRRLRTKQEEVEY